MVFVKAGVLFAILLSFAGLPAQGVIESHALQKIREIVDDTISDQSKLNLLQDLASADDIKRYPDTQAFVLHEIAKVQWDLRKGEDALRTDHHALLLRRAYKRTDPENYCRSAYNLALDFVEFEQRDSAIRYFTDVIQTSPLNRQKSKSSFNIGSIYKSEGDFALASQYAHEALKYAWHDSLAYEIQDGYQLLFEVFNLMLHQGDKYVIDSIFTYMQRARAYYNSLDELKGGFLLNYALVLWYESNAYKYIEEYQKADSLLSAAEQAYLQSGRYHRVFSSERFNSRGILLRRLHLYEASLKALTKAVELRTLEQDSINVAVTHNNIGDLYLDQGMYQEALRHYHASVKLIAGKGLSDDITALPALHLLQHHPRLLDAFRYVGFKADGWRQYCKDSGDMKYCEEALKTYALADSMVDMLRSVHHREGSKLFWREDAKRLYAGAIDAALHIGDYQRGLYFSDRSKAILVLDAVREHMVRDTPAKKFMDRKDSVQQKITILEQRGQHDEEWVALNTALDQINVQLKQVIPHYSEESDFFSVARLTELQQQLQNDEAVIEYFHSPASKSLSNATDTLYVFLVTHERIKAFGLKYNMVVEAVKAYHASIEAFLGKGLRDTMLSGPDVLYTLLINPLEPLPQKLTIIPDGVIAQVAFDGLRDENGQYLIESKTIRYDLSLAMAHEMSLVLPAAHEKVLSFAPMTESLCDQSTLPFTRMELNGIASIAKSKQFFGSAASKRQLLNYSDDYGVLHLATHASANTDEPGKSWMAFSGDTSACDLLFVQDLYTQHLPVSMVVVSACEGAHGVYASGEGAMSVARGFAYAGAASIVTSLWQVNDAATSEIMKSFYFHLSEGLTKSEALRQAKLDYIHDERRKKMELHPAWWSAFIVIGNDTPLQLQKPMQFSYTYAIVLGIIALAVILFYWWKRRQTQTQVQTQTTIRE